MVNLPNFNLRRRKLEPIEFVPIRHVFRQQIKVRALLDMNGWVGEKADRKKWHIGKDRTGYIDEDKAREWAAKGYVEILDGTVRPVSEDELAEMTKNDHVVGLGEGHSG